MQKYILLISIFFIGILRLGYGQNVPNYVEKPAIKTAQPTPVYLADPSARCIRSLTPQIPLQDTFNVNLFSTIESVQVSTQYFDAMGRPLLYDVRWGITPT